MSSIHNRPFLAPDLHEIEEPDAQQERFDAPLGFVKSEPLMSMLRVVRGPPPMLDAGGPAAPARPIQLDTGAAAGGGDRKLAAAGLLLDLAQLALRHEDRIRETALAEVKEGLDEVYRYLLNSEYLRAMREL